MAANMFDHVGLTITFGDVAENHVRMQQIGEKAEQGFTPDELRRMHAYLAANGVESQLVDLGAHLPVEYGPMAANFLIIRNGVELFLRSKDALLQELMALDYDTKAFMYGREVDKKARYNLCFGDVDQEPDYPAAKGRIVDFRHLPLLNHIRTYLPVIAGEKSRNLQAEANLYYDLRKCGVGPHGDAERRIVVGLRLGESFPFVYQWYFRSHPVGPRIDFMLNHGDMYIMSEKAVGTDWRRKIIPTLRHAAGCEKYLQMTGPKSKK